jgi:hypothetical protein
MPIIVAVGYFRNFRQLQSRQDRLDAETRLILADSGAVEMRNSSPTSCLNGVKQVPL